MGAMNDFFGEPMFQPTGTDWIDHAFTAAVLDDMEREERARHSVNFSMPTDVADTPVESKNSDVRDGTSSCFRINKDVISFEEFLEQKGDICQFLSEHGGFHASLPEGTTGCHITPFGTPKTFCIHMDDGRQPLDALRLLIESLLMFEGGEVRISNRGISRLKVEGELLRLRNIEVTINE